MRNNMRTVFLLGLCLLSGFIGTAQTVLPNAILDTMIFEIRKGRQCELVTHAQANEIQALGKENVHLGTALKLSQSESITLSNLVDNAKESNQILTQQFALDLSKEKRKTKRWRRLAVIETVAVIVGLIILL